MLGATSTQHGSQGRGAQIARKKKWAGPSEAGSVLPNTGGEKADMNTACAAPEISVTAPLVS